MELVENHPSAERDHNARGWPCWKVTWVIFVVAFAAYWTLRTEYLYEADSVNFAFCARQFDIGLSDPHPPGYPVWLLMVACLTRIVGNPNRAMILLSICFTAGAAVFLCFLASRLRGPLGAAMAAGLLLFTPNVILYSATATTYTVDLFTSALVGWLAARLWEGEKRLAPWAAGIVGLLAGVRLAGVVLMTPLLATAMVLACRADWRLWLRSILFCAGAVCSWLLPVAHFNEGIGQGVTNFWDASCWLFRYLIDRSAFGGGAAEIHRDRLIRVGIWFAMSVVVPLGLLLCVWLVRKFAKLRAVAAPTRPAWHRWSFYALWLLPNVLMISLFLCPKPCYLNLTLPPLLFCLGNLLCANALALGHGTEGTRPWPCIAALGGFVLASMVLASFPFRQLPDSWFGRFRYDVQLASLQNLRETDRTLAELIALASAERGSMPGQLFITVDAKETELDSNKASYYFPEYPVGEVAREGFVQALYGNWPTVPLVPPRTRIVWWILRRGAPADWIRAAFPQTRLALEGRVTSFYCTEIGLQTFDVEFYRGENTCSLRREVAVEFGRGFGHLETDPLGNGFLWAMGPACELRIGLKRPMQARIILDVLNSPIPGQEIEASFNGLPPKVLPHPAPGARVPLAFEGIKGINELRLTFASWNGAGSDFAPGDERPLALCIRQITIELEDGRQMRFLPGHGPNPPKVIR